jgi:hypothetical protein
MRWLARWSASLLPEVKKLWLFVGCFVWQPAVTMASSKTNEAALPRPLVRLYVSVLIILSLFMVIHRETSAK